MNDLIMGGIIGDVLGSPYELNPIRKKDIELFDNGCRFTDDTTMTIATMMSLLNENELTHQNISETYKRVGRVVPNVGYGGMFYKWLMSESNEPFNSFGNGSAMRISPVGWWGQTEEEVVELATKFSEVTHNHPEGIKGGVAVGLCIFYARQGLSKDEIKNKIEQYTGYDLSRKLIDIQPEYKFDATCQGSVPESIICFLESTDFEDSIRNAIWLGGDSDTMACITGSISEAYYGVRHVPKNLKKFTWNILPESFKNVISIFNEKVKMRMG